MRTEPQTSFPTKEPSVRTSFVILAKYEPNGDFAVVQNLRDGENVTERLSYWRSAAFNLYDVHCAKKVETITYFTEVIS